jgi:hypothetical protein
MVPMMVSLRVPFLCHQILTLQQRRRIVNPKAAD